MNCQILCYMLFFAILFNIPCQIFTIVLHYLCLMIIVSHIVNIVLWMLKGNFKLKMCWWSVTQTLSDQFNHNLSIEITKFTILKMIPHCMNLSKIDILLDLVFNVLMLPPLGSARPLLFLLFQAPWAVPRPSLYSVSWPLSLPNVLCKARGYKQEIKEGWPQFLLRFCTALSYKGKMQIVFPYNLCAVQLNWNSFGGT